VTVDLSISFKPTY